MATPEIVIGIGQAGCRMLERVHRTVEIEGQLDDYLFIPIDTNQGDLDREKPEGGNVRDIGLEKPISRWKSSREEYFYLDDEYQIEKQDGTGQSRPVSRFHIDSTENISRVVRILKSEITGFVDDKAVTNDQKGSDFNIWILNSLGGGTGSGAFPVVTALVHNVASSMKETPSINGIGSLPRLDGIDSLMGPDGSNKLYANSYAALTELRAMINDHGHADWETPAINLLQENEQLKPSSLINNDVKYFNNYWLIGFSEGESGSSGYKRRMNQIAADMIHYYGNKDAIEDFPYEYDHLKDETLAAVSSGKLYVPIDDLREVIDLRDDIDSLGDRVDTLAAEISAHQDTEAFYREVLDIQLRVDGIPSDLDLVNRDVLTACQDPSSDVDPGPDVDDVDMDGNRPDRSALREKLQGNLDHALNANEKDIWSPNPIIGGETPDVDTESVIAYYYCDMLIAYLRDELADHRFVEEVEKIWNGDFEEAIKNYASPDYDRLDDADPDIKWEDTLSDFVPEHGKDLVGRKNNTLSPVKKYKLGKDIKQLRHYRNLLPEEYEQYKKIKIYLDIVETRFNTARDKLREARDRVQHQVDDKQDEKADKHDERIDKQAELEDLIDDLAGPASDRRDHGEYRPPMSSLDSLDQNDVYPLLDVGELLSTTTLEEDEVRPILENADGIEVENLSEVELPEPELYQLGLADDLENGVPDSAYAFRPSLASLVDDGFIAPRDLVNELTDLLNDAAISEDPVQDISIEPPVDVDTKTFLGVVANADNVHEDGPMGDLLQLSEGGQPSAVDEMDDLDIDYISEHVSSTDRFTIRLLSWFMPIALENTHEFGKLNEHFTDNTSSIEEGLNVNNLTDEYVARSFAYPELLDGTDPSKRVDVLSDRVP